MFATLFGQEFRSSRRGLGALAGWVLLIEVVSLVPAVLHIAFLGQLGQMVAILAVIAPIPVGLVLLAVRYWRSMYGQEGYFTMSIPVRGRVLYASKVIYALAASVALGIVTVVGALLMLIGRSWKDRAPIGDGFHVAWEVLSDIPGTTIVVFVVGLVVALIAYVVEVSAVFSVGAEGRFSHMGFGAPLIGLVILYVANQVLALVAMLVVPISIDVAGRHPGQIVWRGMWNDFVDAVHTGSDPQIIGLGVVLAGIVLTIVMWVWATRSIERHTSLR